MATLGARHIMPCNPMSISCSKREQGLLQVCIQETTVTAVTSAYVLAPGADLLNPLVVEVVVPGGVKADGALKAKVN